MEDFKTKEFTVLTPFTIKEEASVTDLTKDNVIKIAGYANWAGHDEMGKTYIDLAGDIVVPGGVDTAVWSLNPQILWQHNREETIGVGLSLEKRPDGLYIEAEIHKEAMDEKEWYRVKSGLVKMFSIGFRTLDGMYQELEGCDVFYITKCLLLEVSIVSIPCNSKSSFSQIKSLGYGFTSDKSNVYKEDEPQPDKEETAMTNIKVKRADLLSAVDLDSFKSLGGDVEAEVEVALSAFVKTLVAREVAEVMASKEKEAHEIAVAAAEAEAIKAAELEVARAAEASAAKSLEDAAKLEEEKALADELAEYKALITTLKAAVAEEK